MKASFGVNISGLNKPSSVWMDDATYKDVSGRATMTAAETAKVTAHLSNTGKTFQRINAPLLKKFLNLQNSLTGKLVGASFKTYNNTYVRKGQAVKDPRGHANKYVTHVENHFQMVRSTLLQVTRGRQTAQRGILHLTFRRPL